jgi:putative mycofactocin binding protein MftB
MTSFAGQLTGAERDSIDLAEAWAMSSSVALRPEPFGALAYHFGNRRLVFLRRPELVTLVRGLGAARNVREAFVAAGIPDRHWSAYAEALTSLARADLIRRRGDDPDPPSDGAQR